MNGHLSATARPSELSLPFLQGGGECGALLRSKDWTDHPLGPPQSWNVMLQTTVSIMLGSRQPMCLCWGPDNHTIYNDPYAAICGDRHPSAMGQECADIWHDIWDVIGPMIAQVKQGESIHVDDMSFVLLRNGIPKESHFSFSYNPLRDATNQVRGFLCACAETTETILLRRELDHERARLGEIFEQAPNFIVKLVGPNHVFELANPAYMDLIGNRDVVGKPAAIALPEVVEQGFIDMADNVYRTGETVRIDGARIELQRPGTGKLEDRFIDFVFQPIRQVTGEITGLIASGSDVTARVKAAIALAASDQFLRSVVSTSADCIKVLDLDGSISFMNDGGREIMEVPEGHAIEGAFWPDFWTEPVRSEVLAAMNTARSGQSTRFQGSGSTMSGNLRYWDVRVAPMLDAAGKPDRILVVSRDNTYLKQIEDEREDIMQEVSHRLKNAFGMVQSVINQTLRRANSVQEGREILSGRVRALAAAQDILTQSVTSEMFIQDVVDAALLPHRTGEGRFVISGPTVLISGRQSLGLSLALHELATNAIKYGALSGEHGCVTIAWTVKSDGMFELLWQETGGPAVMAPARTGFGSVLIEKIVATYFDGSATLDFPSGGVLFHLIGTIKPPEQGEVSDPYLV